MTVPPSIIWSPHAERSQFLVSSSELKLYEWVPESNHFPAKAQFLSKIPNIALMLCADWCPDPNYSDLVAVGLTTGKTLLVRLPELASFDTFSASDHAPNASIPRATMSTHGRGSGHIQYPLLGVKMSRPCNVVSFSRSHPHLLAAGLDKIRNDPCLLVWDISQAVESPYMTPTTSHSAMSAPTNRNLSPEKSLPPIPEKPTSRDVLPERPRPSVALPSSQPTTNTAREPKPIQQYGSSEAVTSCAWMASDGSLVIAAGVGNKYLRAYDIRADPGASPLQFTTKAIYSIAVDPFHSHRLASQTDDGIVKLWDMRYTSDAVLTFTPENNAKNSLPCLKFCPSRSGLLASLSSDANTMHLWNIQETTAGNPPGSSSHQWHESWGDDGSFDFPVLWKSKKTTLSANALASFAFIPYASLNHHSSSDRAMSHLLTISKDETFEQVKLQEAQQMSWEPSGGLVAARGDSVTMFTTQPSLSSGPPSSALRKLSLNTAEKRELQHNDEPLHPYAIDLSQDSSVKDAIVDDLANDISVVMRQRAVQGYSMDCVKNMAIIKEDRKLKEFWSWLSRADGMVVDAGHSGPVDYSYQGVYGIWVGSAQGRKSSPGSTPRADTPFSRNRVQGPRTLPNSPTLPRSAHSSQPPQKDGDALNMVPTSKLTQRTLALSVCGFDFNREELEYQLLRLESNGEYDKAGAWALFCGVPDRAIHALCSVRGTSKDPADERQRKLMSAVLAGYQPNSDQEANQTWRDLCLSLSKDMNDQPYLRAIFAYIASNDWYTIIDDTALPLCERLAVALRTLDDDKMTDYLNTMIDQLIHQGDIEGVIVTGLTSRGVDLFEQALNQYGDVQTVSLAMSFVIPRRFKDKRVEEWVESYRLLLDRWQLWRERSRFDIERGKRMATGEIAPPQIYVRCTFCAQSLGHSLLAQNIRSRDGKRMNVQTNVSPMSNPRFASKHKSICCPSCKKPLPRCAICLMHMGTPADAVRATMLANNAGSSDPAGFDLWFTWCQTCRHGGHAGHMLTWFQKHTTCPVSNCDCKCNH